MAVFRERPYGCFNFRVDFGDGAGEAQSGFTEVSGLSAEAESIEYRNGAEAQLAPRKLSGLTKYGDVTLKRGVIGSTSFWDWFRATRDGAPERRNVVVQLVSEDRTNVVVSWKLRNAFPIKYVGPTLDARTSEVAIESLTLSVEGIEVE